MRIDLDWRHILVFVLVVLLTVLALAGLWNYVSHRENGWSGGPYIHGDWLINVHGVLVRRGLLGSVLLVAADTTGVNAIPLLTITMSLLFVVFSGITLWLLLRLTDRNLAILLLACPALPLIFWAAVPYSAFKKELLVYCALALLILATQTRRSLYLALSVVMFALCALGHELALMWLPVFLTILYLATRKGQLEHTGLAAAILVAVTAATTTWHLTFTTVADAALICAELIERNIAERTCQGSIDYLGFDVAYARDYVASFLENRPRGHFELAYVLSLLPFLICAWLCHTRRVAFSAVLMCGLPFLPLYFVGVDWGRWMAFHMVSASFLLIYLILSGWLTIRRPPQTWVALGMLCLAMIWAPSTNMEIRRGGAAYALADVLR